MTESLLARGTQGLELLFKSSNLTASVLAGDSAMLLSLQEASPLTVLLPRQLHLTSHVCLISNTS